MNKLYLIICLLVLTSCNYDKNDFYALVEKGKVEEVRKAIPKLYWKRRYPIVNEALRKAVRAGHTETARVLMENEGYANDTDHEGETAFRIVCRNGNTALAKAMLKQTPKVVKSTGINGTTPLQLALTNQHVEIADLIINTVETDMNPISLTEDPPLILAINLGLNRITEKLIERGADVNIKSQKETPALFVAIQKGNANIVTLLLEKGAKKDDIIYFENTEYTLETWCNASFVNASDEIKALVLTKH